MSNVAKYYDTLIDDNNDPVHDPEPLKSYMDKWDGQQFIDDMLLTPIMSVLEIGVGTGRLAIRVAPLCKHFVGIDISPKTIIKARENLKNHANIELLALDFMNYIPKKQFDVIYSSLTFMHISEKKKAIEKVYSLLNDNGRFILSIDKSQNNIIDYGTRKITIFPDQKDNISRYLEESGMKILKQYETDFAYVFVAGVLHND